MFRDLEGNRLTSSDQISEIVRNGWFSGYGDLPGHAYDYTSTEITDWVEIDKENKKRSDEISKRFQKDNPDVVFYQFSYSDNDGEFFSAMEHGGLFENVPHITISNH